MSKSEPTTPIPQQSEEVLFTAALKCPPSERAAFLDGACRGDVVLRQRLDALLAAHEQDDALPATPLESAGIKARNEPVEEYVGRTIGRYKLMEKIGEGGCGVVYLAEQIEPIRRRVALKLIKPGMDTKAVIARFEAERQALAMMDHPNIARVLDGGTTAAGLPFFVMELVHGLKITGHCDQHKLSTEERIKLFVPICRALQHAHEKGIIHRDIKPSNVFVTMHDGVAMPKVIDFGIAKAVGNEQLTDKTVFTALDQFIGTPAYMSPEQAERREQAIDARTDVYSLGVLLYELLVGRTPFDTKALLESGFQHMLRTIREQDPPRPSTRLGTLDPATLTSIAQVRRSVAPHLIQQIRGELDWIAMKCLEKDRERRYQTAQALAEDAERFLEHKPVTARAPSATYQLRKFVRRNRLAVAMAAFVGVILAISTGIVDWQARRVQQAEQKLREAGGLMQSGEKKAAPVVAVIGAYPGVHDTVVTSTADSGLGTLRYIAENARANVTITFAPILSGRTIQLTSGLILLDRNLTIDGSGLKLAIVLDGNNSSCIFHATAGVCVLDSLVITNGRGNYGGGIYNESELTLKACTVAGNHATGGGGIASSGSLRLINCTVAGNTAQFGAGIFLERGQLRMNHVTVTANLGLAGTGGLVLSGGRAVIRNSIIAGNTNRVDPDVDFGGSGADLTLAGYNLIGQNAVGYPFAPGLPNGHGQYVGTVESRLDPRLAPLGNYGGPTPTMPSMKGSLAIDTGAQTDADDPATDQRGFHRPAGAHPDIGAVEVQ